MTTIEELRQALAAETEARQRAEGELATARTIIEAYKQDGEVLDELQDAGYPTIRDAAAGFVSLQSQLAAETLRRQEAEQERDALQKTLRIIDLSTPLEEDLSGRIDEMCKHLAQEQGFTLNGIARLFIECQKRMAADWVEIGRLRRDVKAAERSAEGLRTAVTALTTEWRARAEAGYHRTSGAEAAQAYVYEACADQLAALAKGAVR